MKSIEQTTLYGLQTKNRIIISSLKEKPGLSKIGKYQKKKQHLIETLMNEVFTFYLKKNQLYCIYNQGGEEPNEILAVEMINYSTDFQKRNHGIIDESVLQKKTVLIIGLGSGGSEIAVSLARAGVANFILIDFDTVNISNICRSVYDVFDIGKRKTNAIFYKLLMINPTLNIKLFNEDVLEMADQSLRNAIDTSDIIIEATDSVKTKVFINGLAYHSKPVLYPSVYDLGQGGDILFTIPGLPCFECVFKSITKEMKELKKGDWDYSSGQTKPMPALISDIKVVAARTVKIALAILTANTKDCFIEKITEPGCTILFIGNEKGSFIFEKPFQEVWAETTIDPECSCQTLR
ncbi:MAG: ThiF family adenylyltransferase [Deltaproteobacteria bacterium]|nr:ThiF family adenylyltransferase [Deltaproteobacteria bacterium]MBW2044475.1 ThiF family adenylyltransferase [Deltaproteobacteria bacterium]